ncbi:NADH dehydrogenase ubiquinone Fe-S protein 4 [Bradyrhizobium pachyrhizi]|uniref:NADH dehydrogenase ubiquinone Fe-S protein 4 n=2 Tax=Bradyrhizobium TaxID=374 RepID=UPI0031FC1DC5
MSRTPACCAAAMNENAQTDIWLKNDFEEKNKMPGYASSTLLAGAQAIIYKAAPSVMTSAPKQKREWRLRFERRTPLRIEPLMGWTEDDDPLAQLELSFPSAEAAVAYAHRQELQYTLLDCPADGAEGGLFSRCKVDCAVISNPRRKPLRYGSAGRPYSMRRIMPRSLRNSSRSRLSGPTSLDLLNCRGSAPNRMCDERATLR